jgi:hypothetical protein
MCYEKRLRKWQPWTIVEEDRLVQVFFMEGIREKFPVSITSFYYTKIDGCIPRPVSVEIAYQMEIRRQSIGRRPRE